MATQQPVYQPTVQEVYEARPDVQENLKNSFEGQNPLEQGTEANTALNDWWNTTGQAEANDMVSQGLLGPAPDETLDVGEVGEIDSDVVNAGVDDFDIKKIMSDRASDRQALLDTMSPTEGETDISKQLIDKRTEIEKEKLGLEAGQTAMEGQGRGITTGLIRGQQAKLEEQSLQRQRALGVEESNLLNRLGIEQKKREGLYDRAKTLLGFSNADVDLAFKIQDKLDKDKADLERRTEKLSDDAKAELDGILSMFEGIDYEDLNETEQQQLLDLAKEAGIDPNLLIRGMKTQKDNFEYDRLQAEKRESRIGSSGKKEPETDKTPMETSTAYLVKLRDSGRLTDIDYESEIKYLLETYGISPEDPKYQDKYNELSSQINHLMDTSKERQESEIVEDNPASDFSVDYTPTIFKSKEDVIKSRNDLPRDAKLVYDKLKKNNPYSSGAFLIREALKKVGLSK